MRGSGAGESSDSLPSPSPPCLSSSYGGGGAAVTGAGSRHYYVAVDRINYKMETVVDLLRAAMRPGLPVAICVASRDELDAVCAAIAPLPYVLLSFLYSDQGELERASVLERFRQAIGMWSQIWSAEVNDTHQLRHVDEKLCVLVTTDACLPLATLGEAPLTARVLINYELATKKETYYRRISSCLATDGIVINMVVGGEVITLRGLEESIGFAIAEMPINISEIIGPLHQDRMQ